MSANSQHSVIRDAQVPDKNPDRPQPMEWSEYVREVMAQWRALLASDPEETEVQEFLELHPSMIPGGSGDVGPGGHHGSEMGAVFRLPLLQGLGTSYIPDFMWVTRSSGLITPILVEIEKPSKMWFQPSTGRPTAHFRDAHDQLNEWRAWFARPGNDAIFRQTYLFKDAYDRRPIEPQYVLVYGRSSEFAPDGPHEDPKRLLAKRDGQRGEHESFISFDSLRPHHDHSVSLTATMTVNGPRAFALSPQYATTTMSGYDAAILGSLDDALARTVMTTPERKEYIAARWKHWQEVNAREAADKDGFYPHQLGTE